MRLDWDARSSIDWKAAGTGYEALRDALVVYDAQLRSAQLATASRLIDHLRRNDQR